MKTQRPRNGRTPERNVMAMMIALVVSGAAAPALADGPAAGRTREIASAEGASHRGPTPRDADLRRYATYEESDLLRARRAVAAMQRADPSLKLLFDEAVGYAVFADIGGSEGPGGVGVLYEDGQASGRAVIPAWPTSLRSAGRPYTAVIFFGSRYAVATFKHGGLDMASQARSVAVVTGTTTKVRFVSGVSVFTLGGGGVVRGGSAVVAFGYLPYLREIATTSR